MEPPHPNGAMARAGGTVSENGIDCSAGDASRALKAVVPAGGVASRAEKMPYLSACSRAAVTQPFPEMRCTVTAPGFPRGVRPQIETPSVPVKATKGKRKASSEYFALPVVVKKPDWYGLTRSGSSWSRNQITVLTPD